jgi:catechol 2,3-dioxygenase-like lactoylglutathione lyase family enzyme
MTIEIDHISLSVADFDKAKAFYAAALAPLRIGVLMEFPMDNGEKVMGLGADGKAFLWISGGGKATHAHIALRAESRDQIDAFHRAALAAGGADNGAPGLRPHYHANYYAAFVLDPEGHNIEAVMHAAPARRATKAKAAVARGRKAGKAKPAAKRKPAAKKKPAPARRRKRK